MLVYSKGYKDGFEYYFSKQNNVLASSLIFQSLWNTSDYFCQRFIRFLNKIVKAIYVSHSIVNSFEIVVIVGITE